MQGNCESPCMKFMGSQSVCPYLLYVLLLYVVSRVEEQVIERMSGCASGGPLIMDEDHWFNLGLNPSLGPENLMYVM